MIVHLAITDAIENDHKSVMTLTFALFSRSVFPTILEPRGTGNLDLKEFWLSFRTKKPQQPNHLSLCRGPCPD